MMEVMHQTFAKRGGTLQSANQQVARSAAELIDTIEPLRQAAKFEAENIGHTVNQLVSSCMKYVTRPFPHFHFLNRLIYFGKFLYKFYNSRVSTLNL